MRDEDIHIGDVLRIRQWEDMVAEYGMTTSDEYSYYCATQVCKEVRFVKQMKHLCGLNFTVSNVYDVEVLDNNIKFYRSKENVEGKKVLLLLPETNKNVYMSARNLQRAEVMEAATLNTYKVLNADVLVMTENSLKTIDGILNK